MESFHYTSDSPPKEFGNNDLWTSPSLFSLKYDLEFSRKAPHSIQTETSSDFPRVKKSRYPSSPLNSRGRYEDTSFPGTPQRMETICPLTDSKLFSCDFRVKRLTADDSVRLVTDDELTRTDFDKIDDVLLRDCDMHLDQSDTFGEILSEIDQNDVTGMPVEIEIKKEINQTVVTKPPYTGKKRGRKPKSQSIGAKAQGSKSVPGNKAENDKKRRLGPRSKNGCWTCRVRHKACPENRPHCSQCIRLNLECDYSEIRPEYMYNPATQAAKLKEIRVITNKHKRVNFTRRKKETSGDEFNEIDELLK